MSHNYKKGDKVIITNPDNYTRRCTNDCQLGNIVTVTKVDNGAVLVCEYLQVWLYHSEIVPLEVYNTKLFRSLLDVEETKG